MILRIIYVIVLIVYAWLTGILAYAIYRFGPPWFSLSCMLIGIGIMGVIGHFGLRLGRRLASVKGDNEKYSVIYVGLVGYLLLMAIVSFVVTIIRNVF